MMENQIAKVLEYKEERVLTTQQLAESYETTSKTISNNYTRNRNRFREGVHYFKLTGLELREFRKSSLRGIAQVEGIKENANAIYLWTERGCLLHAKLLETDKAWEVYEALVDTYFRVKEIQKLSTQNQITPALMSHINTLIQKVDNLELLLDPRKREEKIREKRERFAKECRAHGVSPNDVIGTDK
jgi:hypothetical protein